MRDEEGIVRALFSGPSNACDAERTCARKLTFSLAVAGGNEMEDALAAAGDVFCWLSMGLSVKAMLRLSAFPDYALL
ncbi:hypothetical protein J1N35_028334 [Gossypium stocksii]|uniref:Uncharacterized protein n=1 Tax=Gossypium stocksii TaxID=47602 RepID=A0A9D3UVS3_9ROSI|nr:hypothetical protein J1N35_028334 [Gossypium stocksii]